MKIGTENLLNTYSVQTVQDRGTAVKSAEVRESAGNFDEAVITSSSRQIEEKIFSERTAKAVQKQVLTPEDRSGRIAELKAAVAEGSYQPDSREIAARILLLGRADRSFKRDHQSAG